MCHVGRWQVSLSRPSSTATAVVKIMASECALCGAVMILPVHDGAMIQCHSRVLLAEHKTCNLCNMDKL